MKRFSELFRRLDESRGTKDKVAALKDYFSGAPPEDAAWAVYFLTGRKIKRRVGSAELRRRMADFSGYPTWLTEACYDRVGDLAETMALLFHGVEGAASDGPEFMSLAKVVEEVLLPLADLSEEERATALASVWGEMPTDACLVFNKLLTGGFRVGVSSGLVTRALAELVGSEAAVMAHRLAGEWKPTPENYRALWREDAGREDPARPYPFYLASSLSVSNEHFPPELKGDPDAWFLEWKWDGIRAQLLIREGLVILWSRGGELIGETFPELIEAAVELPKGTVLDGEVLVWKGSRPGRFSDLQRRLGRKSVSTKLRQGHPVVFMAYDLLEWQGRDIREEPLVKRREWLSGLFTSMRPHHFRLSPSLEVANLREISELRDSSRDRGVEGLMLKKRDGAYRSGRARGEWWKWKVDPLSLDAVLVYAQQGHGRRAGLYTDYSFSVWKGEELVPLAKAYSGLNDREIRELDGWIRSHTKERFGPVRVVDPLQVFEIGFDGISPSNRHKSGLALRFPRILRWRKDKSPQEADTVERARELL